MSKKELLINLANTVKDFKINLNENDILNLIKIEKRWPRHYPWDIGKTGKYTVGLISNLDVNIGAFLYSDFVCISAVECQPFTFVFCSPLSCLDQFTTCCVSCSLSILKSLI